MEGPCKYCGGAHRSGDHVDPEAVLKHERDRLKAVPGRGIASGCACLYCGEDHSSLVCTNYEDIIRYMQKHPEADWGERDKQKFAEARKAILTAGAQQSPEKTEGVKHDAEKDRIELFPPEALFAISRVLTFGAKKYADRNWEKGMAWSRCFGACMRHLWAWWAGRAPTSKSFLFGDLDEETQMSHLWHAGCCIVFLITYEERGIGTDDRSHNQPTQ